MLKFPPIKTKALPKGIIYHFRDKNCYSLADLKSGNCVGEIYLLKRPCDNLPFYNTKPEASTLHIYSLITYERDKGWGDYLIDFAKRESYQQGCEGRCSLVAYNSGLSPHTFYKKKGFITLDRGYNKYLDKCNAQNQRLYYEPAKDMFIPIMKFSGLTCSPTKELELDKKVFIARIKEGLISNIKDFIRTFCLSEAIKRTFFKE